MRSCAPGLHPEENQVLVALLLRAEQALEDTFTAPASTWVSHFDEGSLRP